MLAFPRRRQKFPELSAWCVVSRCTVSSPRSTLFLLVIEIFLECTFLMFYVLRTTISILLVLLSRSQRCVSDTCPHCLFIDGCRTVRFNIGVLQVEEERLHCLSHPYLCPHMHPPSPIVSPSLGDTSHFSVVPSAWNILILSGSAPPC